MNALISFCIVTYNSGSTIVRVIESIRDYCKVPYEIVVVDNNSSDNTLALIMESPMSSFCRLIEVGENLGFGAGNNIAVKNSGSPVIVLLNSDAFLTSDITVEIVSLVRNQDFFGVISGVMMSESNIFRHSFGSFPRNVDFLSLGNIYGKINSLAHLSGFPVLSVDWVEASFLMIRTEVYEQLGGFDERFFMYCEDLDLCHRIKAKGGKVLVNSQISYIHLGGYSASRKSWLNSSYLKYIANNLSGVNFLVSYFFICLRVIFGR